ncbi:MAG: ABC transporter permease [Verrucomicrobiales bacterium]|nr:ABC transporter permease [Verrucomicrobiales bacterium]
MNDLKFAFRQLRKNPGFTAVAVLTLALGIGANSAIFSIVHAVLLRPLPYHDADRLVTLWESDPMKGSGSVDVSPPNFADWVRQSSSFERLSFYFVNRAVNLVGEDGSERAVATFASAGLFPLLGAQPILGRAFTPEEDKLGEDGGVVILSHGLWQRRFGGDPGILGKTLVIDSHNRYPQIVIGVMPPDFDFPRGAELWLPPWSDPFTSDRRSAHWLKVIGRLKSGVSLQQARTELQTIQQRIVAEHPEANIGAHVHVVPLRHQMLGELRPALWVLTGVVGFLLLIACTNIANFLLARAVARQKEIAIRVALGAGQFRLTRQLLTESLLLSLLGGSLGVWGAAASMPLMISLAPPALRSFAGIGVDGPVLLFTLLVSVMTSLLFGLVPALQATRSDLNTTLKDGVRIPLAGPASNRLRSLLVVTEVSLATVLLVGAGLMVQTLGRLLRTDPGFRVENLLVANFDMTSARYSSTNRPQVFFQRLMERLALLPGVRSVGGATKLPLRSDSNMQTFSIEHRPPARPGELVTGATHACTPDFFRALGVSLLRGRAFTDRDGNEAPRVVIINQTMAQRYFPNEEPLGQRLVLGDRERMDTDRNGRPNWREIVGVVADVKSAGLAVSARPEVYSPYQQWPWHSASLVLRTTGDPAELAAALRNEVRSLDKEQPVANIRTMEHILAEAVAQPRFRASLVGLFSGLALALAALGIYGVLAFAVTQRGHEIGIRMALGAQHGHVLRMVLRQGMGLVAVGIGIGLAAASALTRVLRNLLFGVSPTDPVTFIATALLLGVVALFACWLPARRAAKVDPMEALRHE